MDHRAHIAIPDSPASPENERGFELLVLSGRCQRALRGPTS